MKILRAVGFKKTVFVGEGGGEKRGATQCLYIYNMFGWGTLIYTGT